jgi:predicted DsbA family dithiol-disulfide isomerase
MVDAAAAPVKGAGRAREANIMYVDIFSDTICPWCYIGKRRFARALALRPQPALRIRWRAFQLNPTMPDGGMDRQGYLEAKFGSAERARALYETVRAAGAGESIDFRFDLIRRTPNTLSSHRLLRRALAQGRQDDLLERVFNGYFEQGLDIGDKAVLADMAEAAGMDRRDALDYLNDGADTETVLAEDTVARRAGINGVPCFIFNGRFALSGAQEPEAFLQMFDLAREDRTMGAEDSARA